MRGGWECGLTEACTMKLSGDQPTFPDLLVGGYRSRDSCLISRDVRGTGLRLYEGVPD